MWLISAQFQRPRHHDAIRVRLDSLSREKPEVVVSFEMTGHVTITTRQLDGIAADAARPGLAAIGEFLRSANVDLQMLTTYTRRTGAAEPVQELVGVAEIADMLKVSRPVSGSWPRRPHSRARWPFSLWARCSPGVPSPSTSNSTGRRETTPSKRHRFRHRHGHYPRSGRPPERCTTDRRSPAETLFASNDSARQRSASQPAATSKYQRGSIKTLINPRLTPVT
ncbi:hypothetical protein [Actinoplanes lobatus]|uniref:Uncharacterized protein n=1 Tax=Actinoplanes lobatus TaxID=113568 RepID=A0A7W7MDP9_9ACTN|nr:hypothetical protein [Actinoplanes lobatus]MBB4746418.1 hypothetical protein [Actinoplanes lobatus]